MGMSIISDLLHHQHHMLSCLKCIRGPEQVGKANELFVVATALSFLPGKLLMASRHYIN